MLIPEGTRREVNSFYRTATTDQRGAYTLKSIPPGDYRLYAFDTVEFGSYQDPEWLKPYESNGERVSIKDSANESKSLKLVVTAPQQ